MALPHYGGPSNATKNYGTWHSKPKNYSRKITKDGYICSCLCPIRLGIASIHFDYAMIKYEIEPNKNIARNNSVDKKYKYSYQSYQYSGTFKKLIELPKYFDYLDETDFNYKTGHFTRDGIEVPFVYEIEVVNVEKYNIAKNRCERKKKLNKIINL